MEIICGSIVLNYRNSSEPTLKTLRVSSVWRIRQINLYKKLLMNASIQYLFLTNLLGSEQLQITNESEKIP